MSGWGREGVWAGAFCAAAIYEATAARIGRWCEVVAYFEGEKAREGRKGERERLGGVREGVGEGSEAA